MKDYKLVTVGGSTVNEGPNYYPSEMEAWEELRQYLEPGDIAILYVYKKIVLPLINPEECLKAYRGKYNSEHDCISTWEWVPLFAGRAEDKYTPVQSINKSLN